MKKQKGFTLIELLVVIAIIGILSATILTSLNSTRVKGRVAAVQQALSSVKAAANICMVSNTDLNTPAAPGTTLVCTGDLGIWPTLSAGWSYAISGSPSCHNTPLSNIDFVTSNGDFSICAYSSSDLKSVTCTEKTCVVSTYQ